MDFLDALPQFVHFSRLDAAFAWEGQQQCTIHPSRTRRQVHDKWIHQKKLGTGGQGTVDLQAMHTGRSGVRYRAVKSIRVPENKKSEEKLILRELEALFTFSQPAFSDLDLFVSSHAWFTSQGHIHIAMEYHENGDLARYLQDPERCPEGRIDEDGVHEISSQVLHALAAMHEHGFSHRDLKPANILIKDQPPSPWVVKVGDMGLSKQGAEFSNVTGVRGTGVYMPPEMLFSGGTEIKHVYAIDMWYLGATIYQLLTGKLVFTAHSLIEYREGRLAFPENHLRSVSASQDAVNFIQSLIVIDPTKRLTTKDALQHSWMAVPDEDDIFANQGSSNMLASVSTSRPGFDTSISTSEYSKAWSISESSSSQYTKSWLEPNAAFLQTAFRTPQAPTSAPTSEPSFSKSWAQQQSFRATSTLLSGKSVDGSTIVGQNRQIYSPPNAPRSPVLQDFQNPKPVPVSGASYSNALAEPRSVHSVANPESTTDAATGQQNTQIFAAHTALPIRPAMTSRTAVAHVPETEDIGSHLLNENKYSEAESLFRSHLADKRKWFGSESVEAMSCLKKLADSLVKQSDMGKLAEAEQSYRTVLKFWNNTEGAQKSALAAQYGLGVALSCQQRYAEAKPILEEALTFQMVSFGISDIEIIRTRAKLAHILYKLRESDPAEAMYREAVLLAKECNYEDDETLDIWFNFATFLTGKYRNQECEQMDEAEKFFRDAAAIREVRLGADHELTIESNTELGLFFLLFRDGEANVAKSILKKAFTQRKNKFGSTHRHTLDSMVHVALAHAKLEQHSEAVALFKLAVQVSNREYGPGDMATTDAEDAYVTYLLREDRLQDAKELVEKTVSAREMALGAADPRTIDQISALAQVRYRLGDMKSAIELLQQVIVLEKETLGENHPNTIDNLENLTNLLQEDGGRRPETEAALRELHRVKQANFGEKDVRTLSTFQALAVFMFTGDEDSSTLKMYEELVPLLKEVLGTTHDDYIQSMDVLCALYKLLGRFDDEEKGRHDLFETLATSLGDEDPKLIGVLEKYVQALSFHNKYEKLEQAIRPLITYQEKTLGKGDQKTLRNLRLLAKAEFETTKTTEAIIDLEKMLEFLKKEMGPDHPETLDYMHAHAHVLCSVNRHDEALSILEDVSAARERLLGQEHELTLKCMEDQASLLTDTGAYIPANLLFQKLVDLRRKVNGDDHHQTILATVGLAKVLSKLNKPLDAREVSGRLLAPKEEEFGASSIEVISFKEVLAIDYFSKAGVYDVAITFLFAIVIFQINQFGPGDPRTFKTMHNLVDNFDKNGDWYSAIQVSRQLVEAQQKMEGDGHLETHQTIESIAKILEMNKKYGEAADTYKELLVLLEKHNGLDHNWTRDTMDSIGRSYYLDHQMELAAEAYRRALAARDMYDGKKNTKTLESMHWLGMSLGLQDGKIHALEEGKVLLEKVIGLRKQIYSLDDAKTQQSEQGLQVCLRAIEKYKP